MAQAIIPMVEACLRMFRIFLALKNAGTKTESSIRSRIKEYRRI